MKKGEIWLVDIPSANGHEQTGKRPAIILADTQVNVTIVVPITSNLQALRFPHTLELKPSSSNGLSTVSVCLIFQIRAIDKKRLNKKIGMLEDSKASELDNMIKLFLSL
ncbi:MAG TPA: type II toxin-antitoxin system PemK/MazF family toxin [Candidatus Nanoarchaeia archaeon]|nr:type II toxin-antitoxin system PemK/MazF family toxin [Candidatus Nanoarchaeia archaeon]